MSTLPQGWDFDYDGTRWFYTYKPTGHIQYHFPSEGDEFPDFVDATSPAPALAPEERLESQRQQGRRHNQHFPLPANRRGGGGRKNGMSATARPVSNVWEDDVRQPPQPFQPESFMYLGPGSYLDVSPLVEEEDEAARRVVAGGSPGSSMLTPADSRSRTGGSPMEGQWALPAQSPHFSPHISESGSTPEIDGQEVVHMLDGQEMVHMLDGREIPVELEGVTRFNPVGVVAEMETGETAAARAEKEPVEMASGETLAPIERTFLVDEGKTSEEAGVEVEEALRNLEKESSSRGSSDGSGRPLSDPMETTQLHEEATGDAAPKHLSDPPYKVQQPPKSTFKIARKPTNAKYKPYLPGQASDKKLEASTDRVAESVPIRRDHSLLMSSKYGEHGRADAESTPSSLVVGQDKVDDAQRQSSNGAEWEKDDDNQALQTHPSILNPSKDTNRDSAGSSKIAPALDLESPVDPAVKPEQEPTGVTKFPSVLKPARGRAPSIPPKQSRSWPTEDMPKKSYERDAVLEEGDRRYVPYAEPTLAGAQRPFSDVQPTIEGPPDFPEQVRPASVMPVIETPPAPEPAQPNKELHLPYRLVRANSSEVHQPTSISATPDDQERPVAFFEAIPSLAFASGGVPSPASSEQTPPFSPKDKVVASPEEVSPLRSRETSLSSGVKDTPSPVEVLRRGSSVVSHAQTIDGMSTWTPSPQSETPPSASQTVPPQRKLSGLRHPVPDGLPEESNIISPASSSKTPFESGPLPTDEEPASYFPAAESIHRLSLPYSLLEDSDTSPVAPTPPPKNPERQQASLQRSKSLHETKSPEFEDAVLAKPVLVERPPMMEMQMGGGHVLHAIEEDDEEEPQEEEEEEEEEEVFVATRVVLKRHSLSSGSIQVSPPRNRGKGLGSPQGMAFPQSVQTPPSNGSSWSPQPVPVAHQRTVSQPVQHQAVRPEPDMASQTYFPPSQPPLYPQQTPLAPKPVPTVSHQRAVSQPTQAQVRHPPNPQPPYQPHLQPHQQPHQQPYQQPPPPPLNPQHVPQWQLPPNPHHQPQPPQQQQWHIPLPPPQPFSFGTTTQVSSPGQKDRERGWKKLFKKTPTRESAPISAPILSPPTQMHPQQYYVPAGQMPPGVQYPPQWIAPGTPIWQPPPPMMNPPLGNVQLPPAVGDRPGVSRIPGFEVSSPVGNGGGDQMQRMPTVRRHSALGSNPFDQDVLPPPLFDKETAP